MTEYILESKTTKGLDMAMQRIIAKLPDIKHNRTAVGKTRGGKDISYSYTDLPEMLRVVKPLFEEEGIMFESTQIGDGYVKLMLKRIVGGEEIEFSGIVHRIYDIKDDYPHQRTSSYTTARRLFLYGKLGIHPASDDDGNAAQGNDVRETLGDYQSDKVKAQLAEMHEKLGEHPFMITRDTPRSDEEVQQLIQRIKEYQIETLVKYDRRRYKSLEHFLQAAPLPLLGPSINAALNKISKQ
jgi:hypothetical protein